MSTQIEQFQAGQYQTGYEYRYFHPTHISGAWMWQDASINHLLEKAAVKLGELNSFSRLIPNLDLFIQLHVTKEAVVSSRIEGTQTNMQQALLPKHDISPELRDDWQEVQNYIRAMNQAIADLAQLPLSSRLLKQTHQILLDGVRGEHKLPGEFRSSQNWIGGRSLADATFIPPHHQYVGDLMSDLEHFLHDTHNPVPALIKIAIAHYQFETIHPFLDGNGRIGRLMITLFLVEQNILSQPLLYLSRFFEQDKGLYYDNLMRVRQKNDLVQWIKYFLVGIEQTAREAVENLTQIMALKARTDAMVAQLGRRSPSAHSLMNALYKNPVISVEGAQKACALKSHKAANELVGVLVDKGILVEITGQTRNRVFLFEQYVEAFGQWV